MARFENEKRRESRKFVRDFFNWQLGLYKRNFHPVEMPEDFFYPAGAPQWVAGQPTATWIGHSTYLLEIDGLNILTDPVWDSYCSPVPIKHLRRYTEPSVAFHDLPRIDIVLISHNHYDHLDAKTVALLHKFHPEIEWVVPEKLSPWFLKRGIHAVHELPWWQNRKIKGASIHSVPTQHFSGRTLWDTNKTHWNGYVVEVGGRRIYFVGDTGYNDRDFKAIGAAFSHMDLSLIPIGTYWPHDFMSYIHVGPNEAVKIHRDVKSLLSLGMHWNTFRLSDEPANRPPFDLFLAMQENNLPHETFLPIEQGIRINF